MAGEGTQKNKLISFRVSEAEYDLINQLAEGNELRVSEYLRKRALGGELVKPKMSKQDIQEVVRILHKIQTELGHQGGNIHQIARYLRLNSSLRDFLGREVYLNLVNAFEALQGKYGRFKREAGEVWRLLGK